MLAAAHLIEACRGQYCDRQMTGLDAVGHCGVFGLEFLVGVDVVGEGDKEGVVLQIDHRGVKFLYLAHGRATRVEGGVDGLLAGLEALVVVLELRIAQHQLQEAATDGQCRAAALSQRAPAEVYLPVLATDP